MKTHIVLFISVTVILCHISQSKAELFPESLKFEISAAYGTVSPSEINDYLSLVNKVFQGSYFDDIRDVRGITFGVRQGLSSNFGIIIGGGYFVGATNKQPISVTNPEGHLIGEIDQDYRLLSIPISIGPEIWYDGGKFTVRTEISGVLHFIKFENRIEDNQDLGISDHTTSWSGTSLGINISLSAEWNPISIYYLGSRIGYGITENAELTFDDYGDTEPIKADLSGYHISIYMGVAPWN